MIFSINCCSPLQTALTPDQVPLSRQTRVEEPRSWYPCEQTKWTSCPTKCFEPNFVPCAGASREGQVAGAVEERRRVRRVTCGVSLPASSGILRPGIYTCHWAARSLHGKQMFKCLIYSQPAKDQPLLWVSEALQVRIYFIYYALKVE